MGDEFEQYKVSSSGSEDEFAQYKVPSSPAITPPPAAGPHIDMHRSPLLGDPNADIDEPGAQAFFRGMSEAAQQGKITPQGLAKGAASDLWTLTKAAPQAMVGAAFKGKYWPLGKPDPEQVMSAGTNVGVGMLLGGMEAEGIPPTQGLNRAINGVPKAPVAGSASVAAKLLREVPGMGGLLRKFDLLKDLMPEQNVPRGTPAVPTTNGVPWGQGKFGTPMAQWGERVPVYPGAPFPETPAPEVLNPSLASKSRTFPGQHSAELIRSKQPIAAPVQTAQPIPARQGLMLKGEVNPVYPGAPYPRNPVEILRARALGQGPQVYNDPAAGLGKIPVKPASVDPWANLKFDKAAQEQARTELGAHADTTRVLERAQEIKTQMMQQGSEYQVVKVGTLPKAKGNPFSGPNTPSVMEPAQSTNISLHGYHPESQTLVVQFKNGNVYSYKGVPQEIFDNYRNSESQGSFFANNIKGRYQTELRGTVKPTPGVRVKQALGGQP